MSGSRDDDAVGYGRPPKAHQFKKGQSGNPKGRPPASRNLHTAFEEALNSMVTLRENGEARRVPASEALALALLRGGLKGDPRHLKICLDLMSSLSSAQQVPPVDRQIQDAEDQALVDDALATMARTRSGDQEGGAND
jgi:hypothetical protein